MERSAQRSEKLSRCSYEIGRVITKRYRLSNKLRLLSGLGLFYNKAISFGKDADLCGQSC
jgi:hypothetical protein